MIGRGTNARAFGGLVPWGWGQFNGRRPRPVPAGGGHRPGHRRAARLPRRLATEANVTDKLITWEDKSDAIVVRLQALEEAFGKVPLEGRAFVLNVGARSDYEDFLDKAGRAQEQCMYAHVFATSVLGKMPETVLRCSAIAWAAGFVEM